MICIESLDLYTSNKIEQLDTLYTKHNTFILFITRSSNHMRNTNNSILQLFDHYLLCIQLINKLIYNSTLQIITSDLLHKYYKNPQERSVKQYIYKYTYYYKMTQYYYNNQSYKDKITTNEIPIYYLYIIKKICSHNKNSLKYLINYLCL
uniref:Uncharacterized protein n=1 Tax=Pterocladia lucida TaxID=31408 RepID=A0A6M3WW34_PTELU|nr:hypothetical protein [Pterocladia lucida]